MTRHPVFAYSDRLVDAIAAHRPASATFWGIPGQDDRWDDLSPDGTVAWRAMLVDARAEADALPAPGDRWDALALRIARDHVERAITSVDRGDSLVDLNHVASPFQLVHVTLSQMDGSTEAGLEAVACRLERLHEVLGGYQRSLAAGIDAGTPVAARQVTSAVAQGRALADARGFFRWTERASAAGRSPALVARLSRAAGHAHAAYDALTDWLEAHYLPRACARDAVGRDRYLAAAGDFLHAELDPDDTLTWGWHEVERLRAELVAVLAEAAPGATLAQAVTRWSTDPATTAPDAEAFLARIRAWQDEALERVGGAFGVPDALRALRIEVAPPGSPPGAWYSGPSEDLTRPGLIRYSLLDGPVPLFDQQSTAYHEGFPGHHLQVGLQRALGDRLSRFHRVVQHCTGFSEGWALYAEHRMDELGFYASPVFRAGYLVNQLARACRVVLDIGLHLERPIPAHASFEPGQPWTFDRAVAFMTEVGGLRPEVARSEVLRYLGWPGQAISYKVGQKLILDLREDWRRRDPDDADFARFHARLIGSGAVGLGLARALMAPDAPA